jgi:hypothetical protein
LFALLTDNRLYLISRERKVWMPFDDDSKTLTETFSRAYGDSGEPQVFRVETGYRDVQERYERIARETADDLGIPIKTRTEGPSSSVIWLALRSGEDYERLNRAMQPAVERLMGWWNQECERHYRELADAYRAEFGRAP